MFFTITCGDNLEINPKILEPTVNIVSIFGTSIEVGNFNVLVVRN